MTVHLPNDLESSLEAAVHSGHFSSLDDAMAEAVRRLLRDLTAQKLRPAVSPGSGSPDPIIGSMRDIADEMDEIVAEAMKRRREEQWRDIPVE